MKDYYQQSMKALQLSELSERTQLCYTRCVRQLVDFYKLLPHKITEQQLQEYFLHLRNNDKWSAATLRIAQSGIKFFFTNVIKRDWHTFNYLNAKRERRLPFILSREEVFKILSKDLALLAISGLRPGAFNTWRGMKALKSALSSSTLVAKILAIALKIIAIKKEFLVLERQR